MRNMDPYRIRDGRNLQSECSCYYLRLSNFYLYHLDRPCLTADVASKICYLNGCYKYYTFRFVLREHDQVTNIT